MLAALMLAGLTADVRSGDRKQRERLDFAVKMAKRGSWREARYRWQKANRVEPQDPYIVNNLAVAEEALGNMDDATKLYVEALALSRGNEDISDNARRQSRFLRSIKKEDDDDKEGASATPAGYDAGSRPPSNTKKPPKTERVPVHLAVPPRLDVSGFTNLLVASFLAEESDMLDTNREIVRFLRSEFRRRTSLDVLDVTPAPAVPEQSLEDLIANKAFWKHMGQQHDADLIVSGLVEFDSKDASGFRNVDMVSNTTGQKVRQTQFVEQEEFTYRVDVVFIDGKTGDLVYRDKLSRKLVFQGLSNDPLTAFFNLSEALASDVLSVVSYRIRSEQRVIFRG